MAGAPRHRARLVCRVLASSASRPPSGFLSSRSAGRAMNSAASDIGEAGGGRRGG